jgi:transposase
MMGTKARCFTSVPSVSLDELVPADHFYRHLHRVLDLSFVRELVQECYAGIGRPSIDPVVFFRLQLVMFFEDIRSERLLMRTVADRLSVLWYLGYNLGEPLPDHSSLTRIRTRYGVAIFRRFFEAIVAQCQQAGLVWGRELYFDATHVLADAAMDSLTARFAVEARKALHAHLAALFPDETIQAGHEAARDGAGEPTVTSPDTLSAAQDRDDPAGPGMSLPPTPLPVDLPDSVREELATANATRHEWIAQDGQQQREVHGVYQRVADFRISTTDPDATPLRLKGGGTHLGYQTHYVVDGGKRRIILEALVAPGEVMENQPLLDLAWRACFRWRLRPRQVTGDTAYGTLEILTAFEQAGIHAYMPLPNWEDQSAVWSASHFQYEPEADQYRCPQGTILQRIGELDRATGRQLYRAPASVCNACPVKAHCTTSDQGRRLSRHVGEEYRERVQAYQQTPAYEKALRKRQVWVEPLFAEGKQWHGMRRFRLRRLWRVNCEALLIATGQNLKRLLQKRGWGRRPFPNGAAMAADGFYASLYINFLGDHPRGRRGSATLRRAQPRPSAQRTAIAVERPLAAIFQHAAPYSGHRSATRV